jgi:sterol desaturase/sphingolipid hydroxylase (fatty acid hydroxylase superfamily)
MVTLSDRWVALVTASGLDDRKVFVIGTWLVHFTVFWGWNAFLTVCYRYNLFPERRILGGEFPSSDLVRKCVVHLLSNHLLVQPIALYFLYPAFAYFGATVSGPLPPAHIILRDLTVAALINDTLFYWGHRMLHHKSVYKYIHKQHHQFKATIGMACEYAHPVEDVVSNLIPTLSGCLLMGSHVLVFWLWLAIALTFTIDAHSGYTFLMSPFNKLPFQVGSDRHDFHHSHNVGCYGAAFRFWDSVMGTDKAFNDYEAARLKKLHAEAKPAAKAQ